VAWAVQHRPRFNKAYVSRICLLLDETFEDYPDSDQGLTTGLSFSPAYPQRGLERHNALPSTRLTLLRCRWVHQPRSKIGKMEADSVGYASNARLSSCAIGCMTKSRHDWVAQPQDQFSRCLPQHQTRGIHPTSFYFGAPNLTFHSRLSISYKRQPAARTYWYDVSSSRL
jgi:hypothetical protein